MPEERICVQCRVRPAKAGTTRCPRCLKRIVPIQPENISILDDSEEDPILPKRVCLYSNRVKPQ